MHLCRVLAVAFVALLVLAAAAAAERSTGVVEGCSRQSSAGFPRAFTSSDNLVVGPLVMVGAGRMTDVATAREFGGNKFPVLVAAGHRVTIELTRRFASLGYGIHRDGAVTVADGHRVVTFRSCSAERALSRADGRRVTFWSGFVLVSQPSCVPLRIWIDGETKPRQARIALGRRCA